MPIWVNYVIAGLGISLAIGWHTYDKNKAVKGAVEAQRAYYELLIAKADKEAKETTNSLLNSALSDLKVKNEEINILNNRLSKLTNSLQQRPSRNDSPTTPPTTSSCTGAELLREDGEFLAGEAARADRILKERDFYYGQYERAKQALDALQRTNGR